MFRIARPVALAFALAGCAAGTRCPPAPPAAPSAVAPPEKDPAKTDGDKYQVILENDRVRVLRYHDSPGAKTNPHHHPDFVLYALAPFRRKLTFPDGTSKVRDFEPGDVITMPAQDHVGENTGTTDTDVVIVELKR